MPAGDSYQFECFVASFVDSIWPEREATNFVAERSEGVFFDNLFEVAVIAAVFR